MKRSEMTSYIMEELVDFLECWQRCSDKRKPHYLKYRAESMLDMLEGFGMLPPPSDHKNGLPNQWEKE